MSPSLDDAPDFSGLIELSRLGDLDLKPVILRVQTDLFLTASVRDRKTVEAFESLAGGLIPTVDDETAEIVARKLAPFPATPQSVLAALAARGGEIRDLIIAQAPDLSARVIEAALADGSDIAAAIARRADLSRSLIEEMASRDVAAIDLALAENWQLALQGTTIALLVGRARTKPDLAQALLARPDLAPGDLAPLFLFADEELREAIGRAVGSRAALRPSPPMPREAGAVLTGFSGRNDVAGFVAALAEMLGLQRNFLGATPDPSQRYELLTLALRAAGLHEEEAVYVFLTLNETVARSVDRVYDLVKLFRTIPSGAARDLLSAVLDKPLPERLNGGTAHQPYTAPDAVRPRMAPAAAERAPLRPALPGRVRQSASN
ncbi:MULTISPECIES: DUF2336 domain-containing protein [Methylobacterium]|uniref:DUF2336 domain-containing protein n=1 Tax=Methylobacterium bullatum TaxID=570505 RepID=A0AAV4ZC61_9HYPH|nr:MULTISPECIES: DUF2336 domain-containing protein [Methylobacterium]KQP40118.1 hypothetical protein ASF34_12450 [Methylobacterium sp. Leaf106]MBD8904431.1 hypothetical protein [Methylobacterium bullatum]TXN21309.1 DUF2336 domain-containing protein [Methylobacterium sp. WL19]GJD41491.1 hypothetical protein OICFNHDK_3974 [Methylobacterium bullatum]